MEALINENSIDVSSRRLMIVQVHENGNILQEDRFYVYDIEESMNEVRNSIRSKYASDEIKNKNIKIKYRIER